MLTDICRLRRAFSAGALATMGVWLAACGGGGDSGSPPSAAPVEVQLARQLQASGLEKNPQFSPVITALVNEPAALAQMDQQIVQSTSASYLAGRYTNTFNRLAQRASIARVYVQVSSDLACTAVPFGGGVAANTLMVLDGKMLDLMADVANGLAMRESGRTSLSLLQIVDLAASQQMSFSRFCQAADPLAFPDASLTPGELDRSVELFTQMTGGTFFHEFGHIWNWHSLAKLREQIFVPGGGLFTYTSVIEDNADIISGILNAKSGHAQSSAELAYDLMAFTVIYRRNPGGYSFGNTTSWQTQYQQTSPTYSSLATRKALLSSGFSGWRSH